jgi:hypothetical protein
LEISLHDCEQREGMSLLEYQAMPPLRDVDHDGVRVSVIYFMTAVRFYLRKGLLLSRETVPL